LISRAGLHGFSLADAGGTGTLTLRYAGANARGIATVSGTALVLDAV
jgi:hypothetical protein